MVATRRPAEAHTEALSAIAGLQRLTELFQARREQLACDVGLTEHQWAVLEQTTSEHFMPSMFARSRRSSAAAVSKTLRQLIDKGLVSAAIDAKDGRQRHYELTTKGRKVMEQLRQSRSAAIRDVWLKFDDKRLRAFSEFASELCQKLESYSQQTDKRQTDKRQSDKRQSDKRQSDKRQSDKRQSDKRQSDKRQSDKRQNVSTSP